MLKFIDEPNYIHNKTINKLRQSYLKESYCNILKSAAKVEFQVSKFGREFYIMTAKYQKECS